jgi:hypothetical protein
MNKIQFDDLGSNSLWRVHYGRFDRTTTERRFKALEDLGIDAQALQSSREFAQKAYDNFEEVVPPKKYGFVFAIPTRITRERGADVSEARTFLPIVEHVDARIAQTILSEMPPCILDTYYDKEYKPVGAIVYVPLMADMVRDGRFKIVTYHRAKRIIARTARFIKHQLQPDLVGLGATIPKVSGFGKDFAKFHLRTTTGHGGTVYLIWKMFNDVIRMVSEKSPTIGIIGAGSISASAAAMILATYPTARIIMYDIRPKVLRRVVGQLRNDYGDRIELAISNYEVIRRSAVIVSAITSRISLPKSLSLKDKIIIDDSQPGSFDPEEVEGLGGTLVWVVGTFERPYVVRQGSFRYGDGGLADTHDVWGCEAEVISLWNSAKANDRLGAPVTPHDVKRIGSILDQNGVKRSRWQAFGKHLNKDM